MPDPLLPQKKLHIFYILKRFLKALSQNGSFAICKVLLQKRKALKPQGGFKEKAITNVLL
jgi:hypothetical protein